MLTVLFLFFVTNFFFSIFVLSSSHLFFVYNVTNSNNGGGFSFVIFNFEIIEEQERDTYTGKKEEATRISVSKPTDPPPGD